MPPTVTRHLIISQLMLTGAALAFGSCASSSLKGANAHNKTQSGPEAPGTANANPATKPPAPAPAAATPSASSLSNAAPLLNATYQVVAYAVQGAGGTTTQNSTQVCRGTLAIQVNGSLGTDGGPLFNVPSGMVTCALIGAINLQQVLGAFAAQSTTSGLSQSPFTVGDDVLSITSLAGSTYAPPRPLMPSLLASTKAALETLDVSRVVTVTTSSGLTDSGTIGVKMLSYDQPYPAPVIGVTFNSTADFVVTETGYTKVDKAANMIFDSMEMRINTNPVAIVSLRFQGNLSTLIQVASDVSSGSGNSSGTTSGAPFGAFNGWSPVSPACLMSPSSWISRRRTA